MNLLGAAGGEGGGVLGDQGGPAGFGRGETLPFVFKPGGQVFGAGGGRDEQLAEPADLGFGGGDQPAAVRADLAGVFGPGFEHHDLGLDAGDLGYSADGGGIEQFDLSPLGGESDSGRPVLGQRQPVSGAGGRVG
ncbi:MAG: hypothetical protein ACKVWR_12405 [Acidimicrobiales bacterium]